MNVALKFSGGRRWTLTDPLDAVGLDYDLNPQNLMPYDVVIIDSPSVLIAKYKLMTPGKVILRLRGNIWKERKQNERSVTGKLSDRFLLPRIDGLLAPDERLERLWNQRVGRNRTIPLELPIDPFEWPTVDHTDEELRILTLTNCDYTEKIAPLKEYASVVNSVLDTVGGTWHICGDGCYSETISDIADRYTHIEYPGFIDSKTYLRRSNVMLHLSEFDIQHPNAVLEGAASNLPVVTNGFDGFQNSPLLTQTDGEADLQATLEELSNPAYRACLGRQNQEYVTARHNAERIGTELQHFLRALQIQDTL